MTKSGGSRTNCRFWQSLAIRAAELSRIASAQVAPAAANTPRASTSCPAARAALAIQRPETASSIRVADPSGGRVCPKCPAIPDRPDNSWPPATIPPPTPVEIVKKTMSLRAPAPKRCSPHAAACASFLRVGWTPSAALARLARGYCGGISSVARFSADQVPSCTRPVTVTPIRLYSPDQGAAMSAICASQASGPALRFVGASIRLSTRCSLTNATRSLVPPRSTARTVILASRT